MVRENMTADFLTNRELVAKFSNIVIERSAGKKAFGAELKNWFQKEGINSVRPSGRKTQIINPLLATKKGRGN